MIRISCHQVRLAALALVLLSMVGVQAAAQAASPQPVIAYSLPGGMASVPDPKPSSATPSSAGSATPDIPRLLSLDKAEEILLQRNLSITAARYGVDYARAEALVARLRPNPTVTFGAEQFDFTGSEFSCPFCNLLTTNSNSAANRTYTFRYDYVIERGGKRELRSAVAESQLKAAEAQVVDATRQQLFQLKQAFYGAVLARENLRVADENLYLINGTERLIKLHVDAGDTAEWELIKFQANKVQYQHDQVAATLSYQQSVRDLLNVLGAQPSNVIGTIPVSGPAQLPDSIAQAPVDVVGSLAASPVDLNLAVLEKAGLANRPDVIAAARAVDAAQKNWELALALRHRDIDVAGEYQRVGGENTFGVTVSIPVFIHNNHYAEINAASAQLQQAKALLQQTKLQVLTDVDKGYQAFEINRRMLGVYNAETLAKSEESFRIAGASYKEGSTSLLELQDAQRTYNQTKVAYNQASFDYRMSIYQLELATGETLIK